MPVPAGGGRCGRWRTLRGEYLGRSNAKTCERDVAVRGQRVSLKLVSFERARWVRPLVTDLCWCVSACVDVLVLPKGQNRLKTERHPPVGRQ